MLVLVAALPAAASTGPRLSLAQAVLTLPAAADLPPGDVSGMTETTIPRPTGVIPCSLADRAPMALHDNGAAIASYATPPTVDVAHLARWVVSIRVFADAPAASAAMTRLGKVERQCPGLVRSGATTFDRTWSSRYVTGGWQGWHTVDVISTHGRATRLRHIAVYLQRGNALIQIDEIAAVVGHDSDLQEARRLAVQHALGARVRLAETT